MKTKIKKFYTDNRDDLRAWTIIGVTFLTVGAIVHYGTKAEQKEAERLDEFTREQNKLGKTVYQLANGNYIAVQN